MVLKQEGIVFIGIRVLEIVVVVISRVYDRLGFGHGTWHWLHFLGNHVEGIVVIGDMVWLALASNVLFVVGIRHGGVSDCCVEPLRVKRLRISAHRRHSAALCTANSMQDYK